MTHSFLTLKLNGPSEIEKILTPKVLKKLKKNAKKRYVYSLRPKTPDYML